MKIFQAQTPSDLDWVRQLFREYATELNVDLCFQNFEAELKELPGKYGSPEGCLLLAEFNGEMAGCVALRKLEKQACEMKRMFVRPAFRGKGVGKILAEAIIREGRQLGYRKMCLDTLARLKPAVALYEQLNFRRTAPYCFNPERDVVFMELQL
jgi:putative acetyltransferase